jgi:hypothetical protein
MKAFFLKNTSKLPFLAQEAQMEKLLLFYIFNCKILPYTTRRTCIKSFAKSDRMDWETKVFFPCAR